jgi:hypothetical protein
LSFDIDQPFVDFDGLIIRLLGIIPGAILGVPVTIWIAKEEGDVHFIQLIF